MFWNHQPTLIICTNCFPVMNTWTIFLIILGSRHSPRVGLKIGKTHIDNIFIKQKTIHQKYRYLHASIYAISYWVLLIWRKFGLKGVWRTDTDSQVWVKLWHFMFNEILNYFVRQIDNVNQYFRIFSFTMTFKTFYNPWAI